MVLQGMHLRARVSGSKRNSISATAHWNDRRYCPQQVKSEFHGVEPTGCEVALIFITAIFAAFSSMYVNDSIAPLSIYLPYYYENINDSQIGWLSSVIFCPSLFMALVIAPFIDRFGPLYVGIFCHAWFLLTTIIMPYVQHSYYALLVMRIVFGLLSEPSWLVQSALIARYMPSRLESMGFGVCMSIATSANLIGFGAITTLFSDFDCERDFTQPGYKETQLFKSFEKRIIFTYWINVIITASSFIIYLACGLPLLRLDRTVARKREEASRLPNSFNPKLPSYMSSTILPKLPRKSNRLSLKFRLMHTFCLSTDYWALNFSFSLLLGCCYGCQTLILTFLSTKNSKEIDSHTSEYFGVVRSAMSVVGGPVSGLLVGAIGHRPLLTLISYCLSLASFISTMFLPAWVNMAPMGLIGFIDGASSGFAKSLFSLIVPTDQLSVAYAIDETLLNLWQFALPPAAGMVSDFLREKYQNDCGIPLFYAIVIGIGLLPTIIVMIRDKTVFRGRLSVRPK